MAKGLNLQFAHIVINYDLPWNPMRIEQRIGRVDRIGQKLPVKAFNLIFEDSVELRVQEVLEEKLATILDEFGVDKTQDVLDSAESGAVFERLYAQAILNPGDIEKNIDKLIQEVREQAKQEIGRAVLLRRNGARPDPGPAVEQSPAAVLGGTHDDGLPAIRRREGRSGTCSATPWNGPMAAGWSECRSIAGTPRTKGCSMSAWKTLASVASCSSCPVSLLRNRSLA